MVRTDPVRAHVNDSLDDITDALRAFAEAPPTAQQRGVSPFAERRAHVRLRPVELPRPVLVRMKHGPLLTVVDLSAGGALVETSERLNPGTQLVLELLTPSAPTATTVASRVIRSHVTSVREGLRYRGACAFSNPLELSALLAGVTQAADAPRPSLSDRMAAALMDEVVRRIQAGEPPRALLADIEARLRAHAPISAIEVGRHAAPGEPADVLGFDVPARRAAGGRLRVQFQPAGPLNPSQRRLLEAGAQVIGVLHEAEATARRAR
jgi:hypothetical protein